MKRIFVIILLLLHSNLLFSQNPFKKAIGSVGDKLLKKVEDKVNEVTEKILPTNPNQQTSKPKEANNNNQATIKEETPASINKSQDDFIKDTEQLLCNAINDRNVDLVKSICQKRKDYINKSFALIYACKYGDLETIKLLYSIELTGNIASHFIQSSKDSSVVYNTPFAAAAGENKMDIVKFFLENHRTNKDEDLTEKNYQSSQNKDYLIRFINPLFSSSYFNNKEVLHFLLSNNFSSNYPLDNVSSPIYYAIRGKAWDCAELLKSYNANVFINSKGLTLLHHYAEIGQNENVKEMIDKGMFVDLQTQNYVPKIDKINDSRRTIDDLTPLMFAVKNRKLETCKLLLLYGADPKIKNAEGKNAIQLAKSLGFTEIEKALKNRELSLTTKTWQQFYTDSKLAFHKREYVIANSYASAAFNLISKDLIKQKNNEALSITNHLGKTYEKIAVFNKAEYYFNQSVLISEKISGTQSELYINSIINLCDYYTRNIFLEKASLLVDIMDDWAEKNTNQNNLIYTKIIDSKGFFYLANRNNVGLKLLQKSLALKKNIVGENHFEYGFTLLAILKASEIIGNKNLLQSSENNDDIIRMDIPYSLEVVESMVENFKKNEGEFSTNYLNSLTYLSIAYKNGTKKELEDKTNKLINEVKSQIEKVNFQRGFFYYVDPSFLKYNYYISWGISNGANKKSVSYLYEQKNAIEKTYGRIHRCYINVLSDLSNHYTNISSDVSDYFRTGAGIISNYLGTHYITPKPNSEKLSYLVNDIDKYRNTLKDFMLNWGLKTQYGIAQLYEFTINDKQRLYEKIKSFRKKEISDAMAIINENKEIIAKFNKGSGTKLTYIDVFGMTEEEHIQMLANMGEATAPILQISLDIFNFDGDVELENGTKIKSTTNSSYSWKGIQSKLKKGEVLIDFITVDKSKIYEDSTNISYYAIILKPNTNEPILRYLCSQNQLQIKLKATKDDAKNINAVYRGEPISVEIKSLYQLCWKPIESVLDNNDSTIFYSPSGLLHQVSFSALPLSNGKYLSDRYNLNYISTSQYILKTPPTVQFNENSKAIVFGNPPTSLGNLKYTKLELKEITELLKNNKIKVQVYDSTRASETNLKQVLSGQYSPQIIHISCHGDYLTKDGQVKQDNALNKSVLYLSGANPNNIPINAYSNDDGILTAMDISNFQYNNTQLVVLSACKTGLGNIIGDEGVFGLQRAFNLSGAAYTLSSLWSVPDEETSILMKYFYQNLLFGKGKVTPQKALNDAQKEMQRLKYSPFAWGAFVLMR